MKKWFYMIGGLLIVFLAVFLFFNGKGNSEQVSQNDNVNQEENVEENEDENNDENEEEKTSGVDIEALMGDNFESRGGECVAVDDTLERGDCFQEVFNNFLAWGRNTEKRYFHFPFQREQDHFQNIFYYDIDENDELGELVEEEFYSEYEESDIAQGEEWVHEHWRIFSSIIPAEFREDLSRVYWMDADANSPMFVGIGKAEGNDLSLTVEYNLGPYHEYLKNTYFHEFAHILTMGESQTDFDEDLIGSEEDELWDEAEANCDTYFYWGCHHEDSYLNQYYEEFWEEIEEEHDAIDWDDEDEYETFFYDHEERFFNSYQGTNLQEDIAESFTFFIMLGSEEVHRKSEMKYDKVGFFYEYDELVELRTMILENIYDLSIEDDVSY